MAKKINTCSSLYTQKVMETFKNPHNFGRMKNPDGIGKIGNPVCGDVMHLYIKVVKREPASAKASASVKTTAGQAGVAKEDVIKDIKFETFGCVAAIATSSIITDLIKGKTIKEAMKIKKDDIVRSLGGLPKIKYHCSVLAIDALHKAVEDYNAKNNAKK